MYYIWWDDAKEVSFGETSKNYYPDLIVNPFFPIFSFDSPKNIRKPKVF